MVDKVENPKAFPVFIDKGQFGFEAHLGMTLRDWFAGQALAGMMVNPTQFLQNENLTRGQRLAREAYIIADRMLAARGQS